MSACSGGSQASPSPSESSTTPAAPSIDTRPTPASSAGPARNLPKPELPEAAKQNTKEGFAEFTQYWLDSLTYAYETGDTTLFEAASTPDCPTCRSFTAEIKELHAAGGWSVGPRWKVTGFSTSLIADPLGRFKGLYSVTEEPSWRYRGPDSVSKISKGVKEPMPQDIRATFTNGGWQTADTGNV